MSVDGDGDGDVAGYDSGDESLFGSVPAHRVAHGQVHVAVADHDHDHVVRPTARCADSPLLRGSRYGDRGNYR